MFLTTQGGILGPFSWIFGKLLDLIYNLLAGGDGIANIGICIILFTVIVKLILFPLTFHQQKSSKINMVIQPELQKIQKKYKDRKDQESMLKQQQEIQAVYDKYGTSMTNGCLPTLIQFPIIMALYRVIQNIPAYVGQVKNMYSPIAQSVLDNQGGKTQQFLIDFVKDNSISGASYAINQFKEAAEVGVNNVIDVLSNFGVSHLNTLLDTLNLTGNADLTANIDKIDQIHSFILGINISEAPGYKLSWALLIPISSAVFNYLSMKLTSGKQEQVDDTANTMMKSMQITMPLMSIFICISLPAGIGIYWSISALISLLTQLVVNFYYDHVDMDTILEKQMEKAAKKKAKRGGKKTFMERMMDTSAEAQEQLEKQQAMKKNSAASLKNYIPSEAAQKAVENKQNKKYKEGSIGAKANIMMSYNKDNK
ncbi:MAG: YidC/Oxa1 family membrane protein insertase [Bacteroidales bacterium]|nr:YidC/Oxa1 family membrane protein insertase [Clostridium sp.]MCM1204278.1 YidC/Oxa1 family membrane protein insertase [Bacteroidales bacterium]